MRDAIADITLIDGTKGTSGNTAVMSFAVFLPTVTDDDCPEPTQQLVNAHGTALSFSGLGIVQAFAVLKRKFPYVYGHA